jgi:phosphatidylserine/phosphatidylglycerophosphate/cardiolipin synthase-like enzyme
MSTRFLLTLLLAACSASDGVPDNSAGGGAGPDDGAVASPPAPPPATTAVRIVVEPSDRGQSLVDAIRAARASIHVTMYLLTSSTVIDALAAQARAGREVRVILDQRFPPGVTGSPNQTAFDTLAQAGAQVHWAPTAFTYTHEKCVLLDGATAWIMTMNAAATAPTDNREYLAVDTDPDDVAEAEAIFAADFEGRPITPTGKLVVAPVDARPRLIGLIGAAKATLLVEGEELSDRAIVDALVARAEAGVATTVVLPSTGSNAAQDQAAARLRAAGARVVALARPYVHAKALVVDDALAYVGSENFSTGSLLYNRELGVVVGAAAAVRAVADTITADAAAGSPL